MPNDCSNTLIVSGNTKKLEVFFHQNNGSSGDLDFSKSVPHPEAGNDPRKKYDNNWYEFQLNNWGTKWNAYNNYTVEDNEHDKLFYGFCTAWCPPIKWLITTSKLYKELTFDLYYEEEGCKFYGQHIVMNGLIAEEMKGNIADFKIKQYRDINNKLIKIIEKHFLTKSDTLKALNYFNPCDDINNLICDYTPTIDNLKSYTHKFIEYLSTEHVLYDVIRAFCDYFKNFKNIKISDHSNIILDKYTYIEYLNINMEHCPAILIPINVFEHLCHKLN